MSLTASHTLDRAHLAYFPVAEPTVQRATTPDAEGPYFAEGAPLRADLAPADETGERLLIAGRVLGRGRVLPGMIVDLWHADHDGVYSMDKLRGRLITDEDGAYAFETIVPGRYMEEGQYRPAHLHMKVSTPDGRALLTTQVYFQGDPWLGDNDFCTVTQVCDSADTDRHVALVPVVLDGQVVQTATFDVHL